MTEITDLNPVDASNTALTGNGIQGTNFVSNFDNAMRSLLGLLGRLNSGAAPIADTFTIADPVDLTKRFRFDGGLITAGQTRVITVPDTNITLGAGTAASITFSPAGNIAATDVQAAIEELDTEKQAADSDLSAIAALSPSNDDILQRKAGAWTNRTIAQLLTDLGAAGTTFQPLDAGLTDLAGLAVTDSNIIVGNGTNWVAESGATARTSLGLGTGNSPEFTAVNLGHASDTTLSRGAAGFLAVESKRVPSPASQASGDVLYRGATEWERLAKGTAFQHLRMNSGATAPEWANDREVLTANRTYYVRTDGSDSNTGLADNAGGAKLTISAALTAAAALDCSTYDLTVQVRDGTFTGAFSLPLMIGSGTFTLIGNTTTPANCIISKTGSDAVPATDCGAWTVRGFKLQTTTSGNGIAASGRTTIRFNTIDFGTIAGAHGIYAAFGANILVTGNYSITGASAYAHMTAAFNGYIQNYSTTVTLTGTPAHSIFAYAGSKGAIDSGSVTFSGAGTGQRYLAEKGGSIETNGGGASYFPGNSAGAGTNLGTSPYGQYS